MSETLPRRRGASVVSGYAAVALLGLAACAPSKPKTAPTPMNDPRVGLKAGLFDAGEAISNMKVVAKAVSPPGFLGITNSDLAFTGKYAIQGNYNGPVIWDISNPAKPTLVVAYSCPASQNDISVYKNLMFMSAEANNGRVDCKPGGVPDPVSKERMRGVRVFDISDIRNPKLIANVQTCRGSHTHTVLEDPKDKENVYIYVSGSSAIRPKTELAGCEADLAADDPNSSRLRIEIIKVPLANPASAAVVGRANIFAGLSAAPAHGLSDADKEVAAKTLATARAAGAFIARNPQSGADMVVPPQVLRPMLDSVTKARGGSTANAADSTAVRGMVQGAVTRMFAGAAGGGGRGGERSQCHDITVYPALGLAGGACEGHGLLIDISNPVAPVRLDAAADSNFAYWHSATFNNDGTQMLFSDEWGGGSSPKCRAGDKPEWGANAIFSIVNKKLVFKSYYKIPTVQSSNENCVAHNGSLIPIPGRDVMVQSWYQGGISVFDWTDPSKPKEIASFDRGPVDSTRMAMGGSWSVYWYNGSIVSSEIARGLDVAELVPSEFISQNEIDAANTVKWDYLNAQGQPKISWPPSFALAKAYTDQLERKGCVAPAKISEMRTSISSAEKTSGSARNATLSKLVTDVEANRSCDPKKTDLLKKALQDLQTLAM
ncbi:LVIVD repeat-containing protein [Gemmatimonas sp.]|uniref:LVIVD repeat-containing protein n=1 Tax=Gemmatimonas sp. TaxID=1962908 RepID=UPI00356A5A28